MFFLLTISSRILLSVIAICLEITLFNRCTFCNSYFLPSQILFYSCILPVASMHFSTRKFAFSLLTSFGLFSAKLKSSFCNYILSFIMQICIFIVFMSNNVHTHLHVNFQIYLKLFKNYCQNCQ